MIAQSRLRLSAVRGALLLGLTLAGGPALAADALVAVGDELAVGKNRTGETCRLRLVELRQDQAFAVQRYALFCEGWTQPSGEITRFNIGRGYTFEKLLTESKWWERINEGRVGACAAIEPTTLGSGAAAGLRECRRQEGDFRALVIGVIIDRRAYGIDTFPTNLPVLEAAVEVLEGKRAHADAGKASGSLSVAIRRAESMVDASGKLTGIQDVGAHELLFRLGTLRFYGADYPGSEVAFRRALEMEERFAGPGQPGSGRTLSWIALDVGMQSRYQEADKLYDQADPLVRKAFVNDDLPRYLAFRSHTELLRGRPAVGLPMAEESVRLRERNSRVESAGLSHSLISVGRIEMALDHLDDAERNMKRALAIVERPGSDMEFRVWWVGESHEYLGRLHILQKRFADSRRQFEAALARRQMLFGEGTKAADSYHDLGELGQIEGDLPAALRDFRKEAEIRATDTIARTRVRPATMAPYLQAFFAAAAADATQSDTLLTEAFAAAQLPNEGDTARAIVNMAARLDAADPALRAAARDYQEAVRRRDGLRRELAVVTLGPPDKREPGREGQLNAEIKEAEAAAAARESKLQADFPRYAGLVAPRVLPVAEVAGLLKPGEALLTLLSTRDAVYVFLVRDGKVRGHRATISAAALDQAVRQLRQGLDLADGQLRAFDVGAAYRLYSSLVGPLAPVVESATHLIVVPTGPLLSLPPEVLVTRSIAPPAGAPESADYRQVPFLGRQVAISVLPATTSLRSLRAVAGRSKAPQPFIGFGDPAFGGAPGDTRSVVALSALCRESGNVDTELVRGLPRLRESAGELKQIARALQAPDSDVILGADATEKRVRQTDLSRYRVVAFATHGLLPAELKCKGEPALALTPPATATADEDGLLDAGEVAQLKLDADWVVLSACNTAAPDGRLGGQSLSGLARAFFYAGARALLVSHWAVASRPTVVLTTSLFESYARDAGLGRASALRAAQLKLLADAATSHPALWAPFVLVGDGGTP
jgi:CHAT domain-containing protein